MRASVIFNCVMLVREFKQTLRLSIPLIVSNVAQVGLGLIDSAMVGSISYKQLAASSFVINAIGIPQVICIGMTIAITALVSIARGQNDTVAASSFLYNGVFLSTLVSIIIASICTIASPLLWHMGQEPEVVAIAAPYFKVMIWSLVPMTFFLSMKQFSDALEMTRIGMFLSFMSLPLNALLNWLFIFGNLGLPRMELLGAGVGTLLTRVVEAIVMLYIIFNSKAFTKYVAVKKEAWKIQRKRIADLLHIGIPSGLQLVMEAGAFSVSGIMVGWLGATAQAAHQIALNCASTTFMAVLGLSMGSSIRTAHAYGSNDVPRLKRIGVSTIAGGLIYGVVTGLLFILFRYQLPYLFNSEAAVVTLSAQLLLVAALFQVSDSLQAIGAGLCRGIKDVKVPTILVAVAYWVIGIPVGYWLAFEQGWGASGIWWGFVVGLSMAALFLNRRFLRMVSKKVD